MNYESRLAISYFQEISVLDGSRNISLVKHIENGGVYVKKVLNVYNAEVFSYLKEHPIEGVPKIYELYETDNQLTVIEEYIPGETLDIRIESGSCFSPSEISRITILICEVLGRLHKCTPPLIHRDINPSNIILTPGCGVVLIDMNAAKIVHELTIRDTKLLGTEDYAAPEQYGFGASDARTDIYGLGQTLKNMLNNSDGSDPVICNSLRAIADKCTRMDPIDRYQSADELKEAITVGLIPRKYTSMKKIMPVITVFFGLITMLLLSVFLGLYVIRPKNMSNGNLTDITEKAAAEHLIPLEIMNSGYSRYIDNGYTYLTYALQIRNPNTDYNINYPEITIALRNDSGQLIDSKTVVLSGIAADDTIWYGNYFELNSDYPDQVDFIIDFPDYGLIPVNDGEYISSEKLQVINISTTTDIFGTSYVGEISNTSNMDLDTADISIIFFKNGNPVAATNTYASNLHSGSTVSFRTLPFNYAGFDNYEGYARK